MTPEEYRQYDAIGLADLIRTSQVCAAEVLEAAIAVAEQANPVINGICIPLFEQARAQVLNQSVISSPFAGVPFLVKDLAQDIAGVPTTGGSRALRKQVPIRDAEYVRRCRLAGLVLMGKTTTPELGLKAVTESHLWGPTRNPWDRTRTPGGSSGGAGAVVAAGIVPMAGANDGGGSIRIPAAYTGLFGLKPSRGRVPSGPQAGEHWTGASADHVISRSVRDSAAMLDILAAPMAGDPFEIRPPQRPYRDEVGRPVEPLRIGYFTESPYGTPVDKTCIEAVEATARLLTDLGHRVEPAQPSYDGEQLAQCYLTLYFGEVAATLSRAADELGARPQDFELDVQVLGLIGQALPLADYVRARQRWNTFARALAAFFGQYDLYLCPTTAQMPARIGELDMPAHMKMAAKVMLRLQAGSVALRSGMVSQLALESLARTPFTQLANLTGTPAMSVPLHWSEEGLPVGVHFGAAFGREDLLIRLAAQLEQVRPWQQRRPAPLV